VDAVRKPLYGEFDCVKFDRQENYWTGRIRIGTADSYICYKVLSDQGIVRMAQQTEGISVSFEVIKAVTYFSLEWQVYRGSRNY